MFIYYGKAKKAAEYPPLMVSRVLKGLEVEIAAALQGNIDIGVLEDMCESETAGHQPNFGYDGEAEEQMNHEPLDPVKVQEARRSEMEAFLKMKVYEYERLDVARADRSVILIDTVWVGNLKGPKLAPVHKSRLCAREFARGQARDDLFAGTPPLLASKWMVSEGATRSARGNDKWLMVLDVKRAFLYGKARRTVYIRLPAEDPRSGSGLWVGRLCRSMYGTRDASQIWQGEVESTLEAVCWLACQVC